MNIILARVSINTRLIISLYGLNGLEIDKIYFRNIEFKGLTNQCSSRLSLLISKRRLESMIKSVVFVYRPKCIHRA